MVSGDPLVLIMPPLYKLHNFPLGRESPKDVWVNQLRSKEKDIGHERGKGRIKGHGTS
jgi:hypothetical protein